jgi:hypothetical protein
VKKLLLILLFGITGCATYDSSSQRSLDFTDSIYSQKGKVAVIGESKLNRVFPDRHEAKDIQQIETQLMAKGFSIMETPPGADYAMVYSIGIADETTAGYVVYDNYVSPRKLYTHRIIAKFFSVDDRGVPENLLWAGTAFAVSWRADTRIHAAKMIEKLLEKFPG